MNATTEQVMTAEEKQKREEMLATHWGRGADNDRVLYHGCPALALPSIFARGICPRGKTGKSNWTHSIESNADAVYLTNSYALYFAQGGAEEGDPLAVLEVNVESPAIQYRLQADEDAVEQAGRGRDALPKDWDMIRRTRYYRANAHRYSALASLAALGTCGHRGAISPAHIERVAVLSEEKAMELTMGGGIDPMIFLVNYQILHPVYHAFMRWLFDGAPGTPWVRPDLMPFEREGLGLSVPRIKREGIQVYANLREAMTAVRDGEIGGAR